MTKSSSGLVNYSPTQYPQLPNADAQYFNGEFRKIAAAINSAEKAETATEVTVAALPAYTAPTAWTPTDLSGAALTFTSANCFYAQLGNICFIQFSVTYPTTSNTNQARVLLPKSVYGTGGASTENYLASGIVINASTGASYNGVNVNEDSLFFFTTAGAVETNANLSGITLRGTLVYLCE